MARDCCLGSVKEPAKQEKMDGKGLASTHCRMQLCMADKRNSVQTPHATRNLFSFTDIITGSGVEDDKQATFLTTIKNPRGDNQYLPDGKAKPAAESCVSSSRGLQGLQQDAQASRLQSQSTSGCEPALSLTLDKLQKGKHGFTKTKVKKFLLAASSSRAAVLNLCV